MYGWGHVNLLVADGCLYVPKRLARPEMCAASSALAEVLDSVL